MTSPDSNSTNQTTDDHVSPKPATESTSVPPAATPEQLSRIAQLVANGELPFPKNLPVERSQRLLSEVQQRRRQRLITYVARTIALDIHRSREP